MTMREFIRANRAELDRLIGGALGHVPKTASCYCPRSGTDHQHEAPKLNDEERRQWVLNDQALYCWARSEGVRV